LLREIQHSRRVPTQVIIAASSQSEDSIRELFELTLQSNFDFEVTLEATKSPRLAGENRNVEWARAKSTYVAFCDADDSYSWNRLYRISQLVERFAPDLILHSYSFQAPRFWLLCRTGERQLARSEDLFLATFPNGVRNTDIEIGESGITNLSLPSTFGTKGRIHHAHAVVRTATPIRFSNKVRCEDGVFCRDLVHQGFKVIYASEKLSNYERPTVSNVFSHQYSLFQTRVMGMRSK
jgi:hypothetical protein